MPDKKTFVSVLKSFGFKKMPWNKCPQGFEKSNYPCYSNAEKNQWCELYLSDEIPYGWIIGNGIKTTKSYLGGKFFETPKELNQILNQQP